MLDPIDIDLDDKYVSVKLSNILKHQTAPLGKLLEIDDLGTLKTLFREALFLESSHQVSKEIRYYETTDIGLGYVSSLSRRHLKHLVFNKKLPSTLEVLLRFRYGNLFCLIDEHSLDKSVLKTDVVTVAYNEKTKQIYDLFVGQPVFCNRLYHLERYDMVIGTVEKALRLETISAFHFYKPETELEDIPH